MREPGFPLQEVRRGAPSALFPDDINLKVPMLGVSFVMQRLLDIERAERARLEESVVELERKLRLLESGANARCNVPAEAIVSEGLAE